MSIKRSLIGPAKGAACARAGPSTIRIAPTLRHVCLDRTGHRSFGSSAGVRAESKQPARLCPGCGASVSHTTSPCPKCSALLPIAHDASHHSVLALCEPIAGSSSSSAFDIPSELAKLPARGFDINESDLRQRMLRRQKELHPDKHGSKGAGAVELAREASGRVNSAYQVLLDPLKRAEYILAVHGLELQETESEVDPELLTEVMEQREALDEAQTAEEVEKLRHGIEEGMSAAQLGIKEALSTDPPDFKGAKSMTVRLKYWERMMRAAKQWTPPA